MPFAPLLSTGRIGDHRIKGDEEIRRQDTYFLTGKTEYTNSFGIGDLARAREVRRSNP
jgi:hypothetical protein